MLFSEANPLVRGQSAAEITLYSLKDKALEARDSIGSELRLNLLG